MGWLPTRREDSVVAPAGPGDLAPRRAPLPAPTQPGGPVGHQVVTRPARPITYREVAPGFETLERAKLTPDFYQFLAAVVPNPGPGMWYASTQSYGNRLEATALAVGADCVLAVTGVQPMRPDGVTGGGRPQLRRAGPWNLDYVQLPLIAGTAHVTHLPAGNNTVAGGVRPGIDTHPDIAPQLSNLPDAVQDHLESYVPSGTRIRRWVRALGPGATVPERFWLFVTSADQLAYVYGARWHLRDPSGLAQDAANSPWTVTMLTAVIGPATRQQLTLEPASATPPSAPALGPDVANTRWRKGLIRGHR
jgi:hypothetical protein